MAMDGHDHRPGLGVGLSPSTQEPFTRFLEEPLDAGPLTLDCLAEPGNFTASHGQELERIVTAALG